MKSNVKKLVYGLFVCALLAGVNNVYADGKIAVFDLQQAILNTEAAQKQIKEFEAKAAFANLKAEFEAIRSELQAMDKDAQTNSVTWSEEQKGEHRKNMEYKRADLELVTKKLQQESQIVVQQIVQAHAQKAQAIIQELIQSEGIGLILNAQAVQYADSSYNITAKITDRLNNAK